MKDKNTNAIMLKTETDGDFFHVRAAVSYLDEAGELKSYKGPDERKFDGLTVSCQAGGISATAGELEPYAFSVEYRNLYSLDLAKAESAVKVLRKISKGLDKLNAKYGRADRFGAFVLRVADVLGIDSFVFNKSESPNGWDIRVIDAEAAEYWINAAAREWKTETEKKLGLAS